MKRSMAELREIYGLKKPIRKHRALPHALRNRKCVLCALGLKETDDLSIVSCPHGQRFVHESCLTQKPGRWFGMGR